MMSIIDDLSKIILDESRISNHYQLLLEHGKDQSSYHPVHLPDVVVFPKNKDEIRDIVKYAFESNIPIVPFGLGSSVEGQVIPVQGGISLDLTRMNRILEIHPDDFVVKVEPGVTRNQLNQALKQHNLFFPVDPAVDATIGGMAATNASGTNAVKYGAMKDQVLGLEVILANGDVISTGGSYIKSAAGYNLSGLFVGSEGTLGIFTELILRVYSIPEHTITLRAAFPDVLNASKSVVKMMKENLSIGCVELVDEKTVSAINRFKNMELSPHPQLFLELSGKENIVHNDLIIAKEIIKTEGCTDIEYALNPQEREQLWAARHEAAFAIQSLEPHKRLLATDVCVPITGLPKAIQYMRQIMDEHQLEGAILGHVGDGNFHAVFAVDPDNESDVQRAKAVNDAIVDYALKNRGTCSGEHGVGIGKMKYLHQQHGNLLLTMSEIKKLFDSKNILNPGKMIV